jgi:hypothetical protein
MEFAHTVVLFEAPQNLPRHAFEVGTKFHDLSAETEGIYAFEDALENLNLLARGLTPARRSPLVPDVDTRARESLEPLSRVLSHASSSIRLARYAELDRMRLRPAVAQRKFSLCTNYLCDTTCSEGRTHPDSSTYRFVVSEVALRGHCAWNKACSGAFGDLTGLPNR